MKEFNQLLKELGITRKEFAKHIGITYDSMNAMLYKKNLHTRKQERTANRTVLKKNIKINYTLPLTF